MNNCYRTECGNTTANAKFCSRSCAASYNNVHKPKRVAAIATCISCGNEFRKQPSRTAKTCSRVCLSAAQITGLIDSRIPKPEDLFIRSEIISRQVVKFWILRWKLLELKCKECGIVEWMGQPAPLQLDHINGDKHDHRLENLRILCANCHCLTPTYGNKDRSNISGHIPSR